MAGPHGREPVRKRPSHGETSVAHERDRTLYDLGLARDALDRHVVSESPSASLREPDFNTSRLYVRTLDEVGSTCPFEALEDTFAARHEAKSVVCREAAPTPPSTLPHHGSSAPSHAKNRPESAGVAFRTIFSKCAALSAGVSTWGALFRNGSDSRVATVPG